MSTITTDNSPSFRINPLWNRNQWRVGIKKILPVKATVDPSEEKVIEKIDILRKKLEQSHLENETLILKVNRLKSELATFHEKANGLEQKMAVPREMFNPTMESRGQKISLLKATIDRWRKEVIKKFDLLRKKLGRSHMKQQMANEETDIVRRRLEGLNKESLVAFQTVAEKNSHEAEK